MSQDVHSPQNPIQHISLTATFVPIPHDAYTNRTDSPPGLFWRATPENIQPHTHDSVANVPRAIDRQTIFSCAVESVHTVMGDAKSLLGRWPLQRFWPARFRATGDKPQGAPEDGEEPSAGGAAPEMH